jgi:MoxR-like ATPase
MTSVSPNGAPLGTRGNGVPGNGVPVTGHPVAPVIDPDTYQAVARAIEAELGKVIVGQRDLIRQLLVSLFAEGHVLLEGVPGLAKTLLLRTLATVVGLPFGRIQFTPDLMPADVVGTQVLVEDDNGHKRFEFRPGPIFAGLVLADEVNRATPKTQSALLEAMAERTVTVGGRTWALRRPFLVMATQNPIELEGTYPLPEAQLDRFLLQINVPFPSAEELVEIVERTTGTVGQGVRRVADPALLLGMATLTRSVPVASAVVRHAVDLVLATHPDAANAPPEVRRYVRYGASPRAAQAMVLAAKAAALLDGRANVAVADLEALAAATLRHRLVLGYEATADGRSADDIVAAVVGAAATR